MNAEQRILAWLEDPWFAGFADGEACFILNQQSSGLVVPRFSLGLRADDRELLVGLHKAFGGSLYFQPGQGAASPQYHWRITRKCELAGLVSYFNRFPLRSKKAGDYKVWRLAVQIYCATNGYDHRLLELREALMAGRKFGVRDVPQTDADYAQMQLVAV